MNSIRQIQELNKRELENGVSPEASWHTDYRDTAYIYIGGLPLELSEGDVITIFSQFGEPTYINLIRDKETGKSKGFAFLKYEDQRSTDLAVDNLGGAVIMGRTLKVDHTRYKKKDDGPDEGISLEESQLIGEGESRRKRRRTDESDSEEERPMLKEERELAALMQDHDDDDPMKAFLIEEKKEEVALALAKVKGGKHSSKDRKHRHHHRSRRTKDDREAVDYTRSSRHHRDTRDRKRSPVMEGEAAEERSRYSRPRKEDDQPSRQRSPQRDGRRERTPDRKTNTRRRREDSREDRHHRTRRNS